jgi:hypothetical protein
MSNSSQGTASESNPAQNVMNHGLKGEHFLLGSWMRETLCKPNLIKLALISVFLAAVDTIQSYYLQRVVNQFSEVNLLPLKFYNFGAPGYILYFPIDFLALYVTLTVLWVWASYILWYHKHVIVTKLRLSVS